MNNILQKNAKKFQIQILDLGKTFLRAGRPKETFHWHTDGLHLSQVGIKKLKATLNNEIHLLKAKQSMPDNLV